MPVSGEFTAYVEELFAPLGRVKVRRMFGGAGIFAPLADGDVMFGLIAREQIYLKVDAINRPDFDAEGLEPFMYGREGKPPIEMSYCAMPERLYDDPDELVVWARKALDAAMRGYVKKPKKPRKLAKPAKRKRPARG